MISFWKIYVYCYNYKWAKPCVFVLFVNRQFLKLSALTPPKWQQMNWALNQSSAVESKGKSNKVHLSLLPLIGGNGASNERYLSTLAHEVIPNIHILKRRIYCSKFRKQPSQRVLKQRKKCKSCQATVSLSCLSCVVLLFSDFRRVHRHRSVPGSHVPQGCCALNGTSFLTHSLT